MTLAQKAEENSKERNCMHSTNFYDEAFPSNEQLPRRMLLKFEEKKINGLGSVRVTLGDIQVGDVVNDNSYLDDYYRYHDVFHFAFASILGWSPCVRKMLGCKRKSDFVKDEIEDGARSRIIEEAISMIIFEDATRNNYYKDGNIDDSLIQQVISLVKNREVSNRTPAQWKECIRQAYSVWNDLVANQGGMVEADLISQTISYKKSA